MSTLGLTLVVGIVATVVGAAALEAFRHVVNVLAYQSLTASRYKAIKGAWRGTFQAVDAPHMEGDITFNFHLGWLKSVRAESNFVSPIQGRGTVVNDYWGGFYHDGYLLLQYRKRERHVTGFGAVLLELTADGMELKGRVLGFGSHTGTMFFSHIQLKKIG